MGKNFLEEMKLELRLDGWGAEFQFADIEVEGVYGRRKPAHLDKCSQPLKTKSLLYVIYV